MTIKTPELVTLWWLEENLFLDRDFVQQAAEMVHRFQEQEPEFLRSSFTHATAVNEFLSYLLHNHILPCYLRGRQVEDYLELVSQPVPSDGTFQNNVDAFWSSIQIKKSELVDVLNRYGMRTPQCLHDEHKSPLTAQYEKQAKEKRMAGRYTLEEAADMLAQHADERKETMLDKLRRAAYERDLPVYLPGENAHHEYPTGRVMAQAVRDFYEETCWDDLNGWLKANHPRVSWRFPAPEMVKGKLSQHEKMQSASDADSDNQISSADQPSWKMKIQAEAARRWRNLQKAGASPTLNDIAKDLAKFCAEQQPPLRTSGGIIPSSEYIRKHVIGRKYWAPPSAIMTTD